MLGQFANICVHTVHITTIFKCACGLIVNVRAVSKNDCVHTLNEGECVKVGVFERAFVFTH